MLDFEDRFKSKVDTGGPVVTRESDPLTRHDERPCWIWTGTRLPEGYGRFKIRGRGWQATHVALWLAGVIPAVPAEGVVDHLCRNTSCVNPAHLEVVSISENAKRGLPGITNVWQASKTHCPRGHALVAPNLVPSRLPGRQCLSCSRAWRGRPRKIDPAVADRVFKELTQ